MFSYHWAHLNTKIEQKQLGALPECVEQKLKQLAAKVYDVERRVGKTDKSGPIYLSSCLMVIARKRQAAASFSG